MTRTPPEVRHWRRAEYLTVSEAATVLGLGRSVAFEMAADGRLPTEQDRHGRQIVRPAVVTRLLRERKAARPTDNTQPTLWGRGRA